MTGEEDDFRKMLRMIREDPFMNDFQKEQMIKVVMSDPDPKWNEDEFLSKLPPDVAIFLIEHFPYPIPKYLRKISDYK
jgi:hypothetical protein